MKKGLLYFSLILSSLPVLSDDIDLYLLDSSLEEKPQVLLIVDTSGSMKDPETIKTPYDPTLNYTTQPGGFSGSGDSYVYYVVGSASTLPTVDDANENRRFLNSINNCSAAQASLTNAGFYTGRIKEYSFEGNIGSWQELSETDGTAITIIDCEDDIDIDIARLSASQTALHNTNKIGGTGYPVDGVGSITSRVYYDEDVTNTNAIWSGQTVTIYTDNYLRWEQGTQYTTASGATADIGYTSTSRMQIAKDTLTNLVNSIPSVKFGLEVYNINTKGNSVNEGHGGKIAFGIQEMTVAAKGDLLDIFENDLHPAGSTPLCESYYEAYQYFSGQAVLFGDKDFTGFLANDTQYHESDRPVRDTSVETNGVYNTPYSGCTDNVFVILITDGIPLNDSYVNSNVIALQTLSANAATAKTAAAAAEGNTTIYEDPMAGMTDVGGNYLPVLAGYMHTNDINAEMDGTQTATLYTVGFSSGANDAAEVLTAAGANGGGGYYPATDPTKLGSALTEIISSILSVSTSFTSPSVATNSGDRTETTDAAYYGMFVASDRARWSGNLKKLKIDGVKSKDRTGADAIDENGNIKADAKTFWATNADDPADDPADGNDVTKGGVVGMFNNKTGARKVYSNIGALGVLTTLDYTNLQTSFGSEGAAQTALGVDNSADAEAYLKWALGIDTETEVTGSDSVFTYRSDLFGDPLHSKPVAINYGGESTIPDVRILIGTNAGVLHMFRDRNVAVEESWAFMPKEFIGEIKTLKENLPSSSKVYGVDGRITTFVIDKNGDGNISKTDDTVWAFFGLRRGGSSYYGVDITDPDVPELLWKINADDADFEELGQTWSQPQVTYSSINMSDGGVPKPVLIFGAGYSIGKDSAGVGSHDSVGRGIYMVDAESGELKWSTTPAAQTDENTQYTGFTDSIPSKIAVLDSDGDGLVDRLYTGDTGGNVFRVDMPGNTPSSTTTPWTVFKLAELAETSGSAKTNANDRRFFDGPSIVRTFFTDTVQSSIDATKFIRQETPYDAILIGSGDRTSPTSTNTNDVFFMIQDENVITESFVAGAVAPAKVVPAAITYDNLYNFTGNPYGTTLTDAAKNTLDAAVSEKSGWFVNFLGSGEKSTAGAIAVDGVAYFTSFTPAGESTNVCELAEGSGQIYAIDLYKGTNIFSLARSITVQSGMPDTPVIAAPAVTIPEGTVVDPNAPPGISQTPLVLLTGRTIIPLSSSLTTSRTYQFVTEN